MYKARKYGLPAWLGHVPMTCLVTLSVISCLVGVLLIAVIILFVWAFLLIPSMMELLKPTVNVKVTNWEERAINIIMTLMVLTVRMAQLALDYLPPEAIFETAASPTIPPVC